MIFFTRLKLKKIPWFFLLISLVIIFSTIWHSHRDNFSGQVVQAAKFNVSTGVGDNVSGFAWSSNYGWISFNSTDCDPDGNGVFNGTPSGCPSAGTPFFDYGVKIDNATGDFFGYAWSSNVGWISFNRMTCNGGTNNGKYCENNSDCNSNNCSLTGPGATGNPSTDDPGGGSGPIAKFDSGSEKVNGWAKVLSLGDDGWMKFSDSSGGGGGSGSFPIPFPIDNYDVSDTGGSGYSTVIDNSTGDFSGWAWNGNDTNSDGIPDTGIGWVSFNCNNDSSCGVSSYTVTAILNQPPTIADTDAPLMDYCSQSITAASLNWSYYDSDGDSQSAYRIVFNNANNTTSPLLDTGKCTSQSGNCLVAANATTFPISSIVNLSKNTTYYWWITVWDSKNASSTQYAGKSFTTPAHKCPSPYFTWSPSNPNAGDEVYFYGGDLSKYFDSFGTEYACKNNCSYQWTFSYKVGSNAPVLISGGSDTSSSTAISFPTKATVHAVLKVSDGSYSCSTSTSPDIGLKNKLPKWIETK